ncbi:MAG: GerMN domain-containing protein [Clostridia bacterium]|nr:GerMN domain-containing protein [Clostridia bacterium]
MKRLLALCAVLLLMCGCASSYLNESEGDQIAPVPENDRAAASVVMPLYFRFYTEPMLLRYSLTVDTPPQQLPEYYAISALLGGAVEARPELTRCFGRNTALQEISASGETLSVTLSEGFLSDTQGANDAETRQNRRLALYSIVNTVCEMGSFSQVQFYLYRNGLAQRPDSYQMGMVSKESDTAPLGALTRNTALILTPSSVARMGLTHYSNQAWNRLYYYLGDKEGAARKLPILEEMSQTLTYLGWTLSDFTVEDNYTVSEDGKTAYVTVSMNLRSDSASYRVENVPLELCWRGRTWLISYESLLRFLEVSA